MEKIATECNDIEKFGIHYLGTKIVTQTLNKPCLHDIVFPNEKMTHGMEKPEG